MLHWRLCIHHVWWLWPLLRRHIHSNSCCGNHSCGNSALYHRLDWVLRNHTRKLLWSGDGECGQTICFKWWVYLHNTQDLICSHFQFAAILLLVFVTECVVVVLGYIYRAKVNTLTHGTEWESFSGEAEQYVLKQAACMAFKRRFICCFEPLPKCFCLVLDQVDFRLHVD